ncbi:MAG: Glycerol kinase, partial [uncultured Chloroflexia bacterium]
MTHDEQLAAQYVLAIDQGTTSTRCMIFNRRGEVIAARQREHRQIFPRPGWVEHDPLEIWQRTEEVIRGALEAGNLEPRRIVSIGITNQRETTVLWERATGKPVSNAIVWQDTRTDGIINGLAQEGGQDRFRAQTGLPLATYFAGPKIAWMLDEVAGTRAAAERGDLLFGTIDTFLLWWLSGGPDGGVHITDVTNASRTMLMNLATLDWDDEILRQMGIPRSLLPEIRPSSQHYATARGILEGVPIAGLLGDQHAAVVGQACFGVGEAKNTYGTGNFMLLNTGTTPVASSHGLLTTVAYQFGSAPAVYALEGSIAVTGSLVQWLRDNLQIIAASDDVEALAQTVEDNGGVYFVPAFSGLFAPYWRSDARGAIVGMTRYTNRGHIARAALEATAFQTREVLDAMEQDSGVQLQALKVDGGMVVNSTLMQFQADMIGVDVIRPRVAETTALGAAYAAGLATGFWSNLDDLRQNWQIDRVWKPQMDEQ